MNQGTGFSVGSPAINGRGGVARGGLSRHVSASGNIPLLKVIPLEKAAVSCRQAVLLAVVRLELFAVVRFLRLTVLAV